MSVFALTSDCLEARLERHRPELTGYLSRMLDSPVEAEDAVQETLLRAWRSLDRFEGRSAFRSWLYKIATNVSFDMLKARSRRPPPAELGGDGVLMRAEDRSQPAAGSLGGEADPAEVALTRESARLALLISLERLTARQRAVLILRDVLRWRAGEVAELLQTSVASVNSALQRARATLDAADAGDCERAVVTARSQRALLARYVEAFEAHDIDALTSLLREDAAGVA